VLVTATPTASPTETSTVIAADDAFPTLQGRCVECDESRGIVQLVTLGTTTPLGVPTFWRAEQGGCTRRPPWGDSVRSRRRVSVAAREPQRSALRGDSLDRPPPR
jgi:hypothetical protein